MSSQPMYCVRCNTPATPGERFCGECGNNLTVPGSLKPSPGPATPGPQSGEPTRIGAAPTIGDNQLPGVQTQRMPQPQYAPPPAYQQQVQTTTRRQGGSNMGVIVGAIVAVLITAGVGSYFAFFNKPGGNDGNATPAATAIVAIIPTATTAEPEPTATGEEVVVATATSAEPEPTTPATGNDEQATTAVNNAARTMRALSSYYLDINADITASGTTTKLLVAGDFSKAQSEYTITVAGTSKLMVRSIGDETFTSSDEGTTWEKDTTGAGDSVKFFTQIFDRGTFAIGPDDTVVSVGNETIEGVETEHIRVTSNGDRGLLGAGYRGTSDFWIANDPALEEVVKRLDLDITDEAKDNNKISIVYSDYNKTFTVQKPTIGN